MPDPNKPDEAAPQKTEFNSSSATLMRIDFYIKQFGDLRRGLIPRDRFGFPIITTNPKELALKTLFNIKSECLEIMGKEEKTSLNEHLNNIKQCRVKYGHNLYMKTIFRGMPSHEYKNGDFYLGWEEMDTLADDYFLFLMAVLNRHGMLMTRKKEMDESATEW